jgi:hypothetical protein
MCLEGRAVAGFESGGKVSGTRKRKKGSRREKKTEEVKR